MILIQDRDIDCPFWACLYTSLGYFRHVSGKNAAAQPINMINILKGLVSHHAWHRVLLLLFYLTQNKRQVLIITKQTFNKLF
jgi:hypothetical protein